MKAFNTKLLAHNVSPSHHNGNKLHQRPTNGANSTPTHKSSFLASHNSDLTENNLSSNAKHFTNIQGVTSPGDAKRSKKHLVIDVNAEVQTYNLMSNQRIIPHTTTNSSTTHTSKFSKGAGGFSFNGSLSTKSSKQIDIPLSLASAASPKKMLEMGKPPLSTKNLMTPSSNMSQNRIASGSMSTTGSLDTLFNQLSIKNSHTRSVSSKSPLKPQKTSSGTPKHGTNIDVRNDQQQQPNAREQQQRPVQSANSVNSTNSVITPNNANSGNSLPNDPVRSFINTFGKSLDGMEKEYVEYEPESELEFTRNIVPQQPIQRRPYFQIPNHEPTKCSVKRNGVVKAYAANTNQGIARNYNEDRVSIILNITKPPHRNHEEWPKCSFFGVYDGHGGVSCADFLRDNLHQYVIREPSFPSNPKEAIMRGFEAAESTFLSLAESKPELDKSGSCAIVILIVGDTCYVANVGDSRAVLSADGGTKVYHISYDHKPSEISEQKRIIENGGKIYQTQSPFIRPDINIPQGQIEYILGPHRVFPGRLSVSRTFGDIEAKYPKYGGKPNVISAIPEIKSFKVLPNHDFITIGCDGIFDKLTSVDAVKSAWESTSERAPDIHHQCGLGVEEIMRESIHRRTLDNITVVFIGLKNFKKKLFPQKKKAIHEESQERHYEKSQASLENYSVKYASSPKADVRPLQDRMNEQPKSFIEQTYSSYSSEQGKRASLPHREIQTTMSSIHSTYKMNDKLVPSSVKYGTSNHKKPITEMEKRLLGNEENLKNEDYFEYLQQARLAKGRSYEHRLQDAHRYGLKGESK